MKAKNKKTVFICQLEDNIIKVIKFLPQHISKRKPAALECESISSEASDKEITEKISQIFRKLGYVNSPIVISLPRKSATSRYIKVPSLIPQEIEKMVSLQASRYLPYPSDELVTAYQTISIDKEGYSSIHLIIAHKGIIERYLSLFKGFNPITLAIVLSSYGLCHLFHHLHPGYTTVVMLIDIDTSHIELAICQDKKLLFSRYFKLPKLQPDSETLFIEEIKKTLNVYAKEVAKEPPQRIILLGEGQLINEAAEILNKNKERLLPVEILSYPEKMDLPLDLSESISNSPHSFTSLIGLGLESVGGPLNLIPQEVKDKIRKTARIKEQLRIVLLISFTFLASVIALTKNLDNKAKYHELLKVEINKIAKEAEPLENIEKRIQLLEKRLDKKSTAVEIIHQLAKVIPDSISLSNLAYEEEGRLNLRGQATTLNSVFGFVSGLKNSSLFKDFNITVKYATQKKTPAGEIVDFEIICLKTK